MNLNRVKYCADRLSGRKGGHPSRPAAQIKLGLTIMGDSVMDRKRENNNNWRGGMVKTQHGYVLIRVGVEHPLADCRGYAYEHRVVAEKKIGRPLKKREKVHHIDGNRANNAPDNIKVVNGNYEHYFEHRKKDSNLRRPDEHNYLIDCKCDCGRIFLKYDRQGRPRDYISGHNTKGRKLNVK